jgi:salicylate hydroxylase
MKEWGDSSMLRVAIVGGGIAGLATAVGLLKYGFDVQVFEQAEELGDVGAGVNISPNAVRALQGLGLGDAISRAAITSPGGIEYWDVKTGELIRTITHPSDDSGTHYYQFHRADLISLLGSALPTSVINLKHRCVKVAERGSQTDLFFENGNQYTADLVIGADGVRSEIRNYVSGLESTPKYTGQIAWRAMLPGDSIDPLVLGRFGFGCWLGPGGHVTSYFLRNRTQINLHIRSECAEWTSEGWWVNGDPDAMRAVFWDIANPKLRQLLSQITECYKWGLFTREPSENWRRGRIQLIGDAAHPMLPDAGQGAAQSIEDAYILSRWLEAVVDIETALDGFNRVRKPRAHAAQRQSVDNAKLYHAQDQEAKEEQKAKIAAREKRGETFNNMNWIYQFDPISNWDRVPDIPVIA